mgnify:CR=1 FL=1
MAIIEMDNLKKTYGGPVLLAQDLAVVFFLVALPLLAGQDLTFELTLVEVSS